MPWSDALFTLAVVALGLQEAPASASTIRLGDLWPPGPHILPALLVTLAVGATCILAVAFVRAYLVARPAQAAPSAVALGVADGAQPLT